MFIYNKEKKLQKKRYSYGIKTSYILKYSNWGIMSMNEGRLEFVQLNFIKKIIKKLFRKSKYNLENHKKTWYSLSPNYIVQCKSKNSRMGKGKGMVERKTIRISKNTILFEFLGISPFKLFSFVKKINKKLNVKTRIVFNSSNKYKTSAKKGLNLLFYTKYLTTLS